METIELKEAKGTIFVNLFDKDCTLIDGLIDINPKKQTLFVCNTGHKMCAPQDTLVNDIDNIYADDIRIIIAKHTKNKINLIRL